MTSGAQAARGGIDTQGGAEPVRVLVVDDEDVVRRAVVRMLSTRGIVAAEAEDGEAALEYLQSAPVDVLLADIVMPRMGGLELLERVRDAQLDVTVVMMTAHGDVATAFQAVRGGAFGFLKKPFATFDEVVLAIEQAAEHRRLVARNRDLQAELAARGSSAGVVGRAPAMLKLLSDVRCIAPSEAPVLILGENGTGKELVARAIHAASPRAKRPFVAINCGAIPSELVESELFGHEKGAFSGAYARKRGHFEAADGGTIFLDEIGDLPLAQQVKLLRVLQEFTIRPVGADAQHERPVDVRIIAATNMDLRRAVAEKRFREDLYYRLKGVEFRLPPLRERRGDIAELAYALLRRHAPRSGRRVSSLHPEALAALEAYDWPGNVRELEHAITRGIAFTQGDTLTVDVLPDEVRAALRARTSFSSHPSGWASPALLAQDYNTARREALEAFERAYVEARLKETGGNIAEAARRAGLDRANFRRVLRRTRLRGDDGGGDDDER